MKDWQFNILVLTICLLICGLGMLAFGGGCGDHLSIVDNDAPEKQYTIEREGRRLDVYPATDGVKLKFYTADKIDSVVLITTEMTVTMSRTPTDKRTTQDPPLPDSSIHPMAK